MCGGTDKDTETHYNDVRKFKPGAPGIRNRSANQSATKCICYIVGQNQLDLVLLFIHTYFIS
jgi:hypothetical protein